MTGDELTWFDFYAYESINMFQFAWEGKLFEEFPLFKTYHCNFEALPVVKQFLEETHKLPFTPTMAKKGSLVPDLGTVEIEYFEMGYLRGDFVR